MKEGKKVEKKEGRKKKLAAREFLTKMNNRNFRFFRLYREVEYRVHCCIF